MTRIMDVAATLRKERAIVDEQLNIDQIKAKLRERLLEAAKVSGDPVTEAEIAARSSNITTGSTNSRNRRRVFRRFWRICGCCAGPIFKALAGIAAAVAVIWGLLARAYCPARRATGDLPSATAGDARGAVRRRRARRGGGPQIAVEDDVEARRCGARGVGPRRAGDRGTRRRLSELTAKLAALQAELELEYTLVIASRPGEQSGARPHTGPTSKGTRMLRAVRVRRSPRRARATQ